MILYCSSEKSTTYITKTKNINKKSFCFQNFVQTYTPKNKFKGVCFKFLNFI